MLSPDQQAPIDEVATSDTFGKRQSAVLEVALTLLVEGGDKGFTTARLARAANCSKESLYRWFGDRDGLLAAMIAFQASKVRIADTAARSPDARELRVLLKDFARDLLTVLSGPTSLALNRLAIGEAGREDAKLGALLIERGRGVIEERAKALIDTGRRAGHLSFDDLGDAFDTFYGLVVGELHVRMLLGDEVSETADPAAIAEQAEKAVDRFHWLYGAGNHHTNTNTNT
jgi:AcrR family transcriptional regulator